MPYGQVDPVYGRAGPGWGGGSMTGRPGFPWGQTQTGPPQFQGGTQTPDFGWGNPSNWATTPLRGSDAEFWASRLGSGNFLYDLARRGYLIGDPANSPITEFLRQQAAQTSGSLQRRAQLAGQVSGLPQAQQGYGWLQGLLG